MARALLASVPLANVELAPPLDLLAAVVAAVALLAAMRAARRRSATPHVARPWQPPPVSAARGHRRLRLAGVAVVAVVAAPVSLVLVARPLPGLAVTVLDIGQGDAILLQASDGSRMLVDGGPDPDLLVRRLDERIPVWDRHIDLVVLTHPHEDHAGGLAGLVPRYTLDRIAETGMASLGPGVSELRAAAVRHDIDRVRLVQGEPFPLGAARVEVLWPPREAIARRALSDGRAINDTSIVLAVSLGQQRVLLTGDLEDDHDADIIATIPAHGRRWDLLKVAHHGSATASSRPLLEVLRPRLAAVSSGEGNHYGHPAPATLERLHDVGAAVWRTDRQGTLSVALDGRPRAASALLSGPPRVPPCAFPSRPALSCRPLRATPATLDPMAVPTRAEALSLLLSTSPSPRLLQHVTVVAEVASFLAYRASRAGIAVDRRLVETAALLHDVDKALPRRPPLARARARPGRCRLAGRGRPPRAGACARGSSGVAAR